MGMNIKSEEAHRIAKEITSHTGESLTSAVVVALRERLERLKREASFEERKARRRRPTESTPAEADRPVLQEV